MLFCARMDCGYRPRNPSLVWDELSVLAEKFGADAFWDVADSAVNDEKWMKIFNVARPSGFTPKLYFYFRADAITENMCHLLNSLNCQLVFVGFESGADSILKGVGVGKTIEQSRKATQLLADHGINIMGSFILGLAGETADTVERTIEFANWLGDLGNLETISASVLMPLPGSKVFNMLRKEYPEKYEAVDFYDLEKARTDWLSSHTEGYRLMYCMTSCCLSCQLGKYPDRWGGRLKLQVSQERLQQQFIAFQCNLHDKESIDTTSSESLTMSPYPHTSTNLTAQYIHSFLWLQPRFSDNLVQKSSELV